METRWKYVGFNERMVAREIADSQIEIGFLSTLPLNPHEYWMYAEWESRLSVLKRYVRRWSTPANSTQHGWILIEDALQVPIFNILQRMGVAPTHYNRFSCIHPNHDDEHPDAKLYENTNTYYCFVCGKGGSGLNLIVNSGLATNKIDAAKWITGGGY